MGVVAEARLMELFNGTPLAEATSPVGHPQCLRVSMAGAINRSVAAAHAWNGKAAVLRSLCRVTGGGKFAFAEFATAEIATAALSLNGLMLHGRPLRIGRPQVGPRWCCCLLLRARSSTLTSVELGRKV